VQANLGRRADLIIAADTVVELHVISNPSICFSASDWMCHCKCLMLKIKLKCSVGGSGEVQSQVLEKPSDKDDAYRMLSSLSGEIIFFFMWCLFMNRAAQRLMTRQCAQLLTRVFVQDRSTKCTQELL
jgi:predicted house-cleaning NTP pyrophosphatase (Maf/HAM1 superfamily)